MWQYFPYLQRCDLFVTLSQGEHPHSCQTFPYQSAWGTAEPRHRQLLSCRCAPRLTPCNLPLERSDPSPAQPSSCGRVLPLQEPPRGAVGNTHRPRAQRPLRAPGARMSPRAPAAIRSRTLLLARLLAATGRCSLAADRPFSAGSACVLSEGV